MGFIKEDYFRNFEVRTVDNGFILTLNRNLHLVSDEVFVFNNLKQLAEFIENFDNTKRKI